jgi:hypothetical protein
MKTSNLVNLVLLVSSQTFAQGFFPLQVGNIWQYQSVDVFNPMPLESRIIGDTVFPNAKQFSIITGLTLGTNFLRQEGSIVYAYDVIDSAEYILLDFAANANDTLSHHSKGERTVVAGGKHTYPNTTFSYWTFYELQGTGPGSYIFYNWTIRDSIGLTALTMEPGNSWNLSGAIVNGTLVGTITGVNNKTPTIPVKPVLEQNYPNPFNPTTRIQFSLSEPSQITLKIFNTLGQELAVIANGTYPMGIHSITWNAAGLSSGIYFYSLEAKFYKETKKMLLLK